MKTYNLSPHCQRMKMSHEEPSTNREKIQKHSPSLMKSESFETHTKNPFSTRPRLSFRV